MFLLLNNDERKHKHHTTYTYKRQFVEELKTLPIAIDTSAANEQHYEVDARFYEVRAYMYPIRLDFPAKKKNQKLEFNFVQ